MRLFHPACIHTFCEECIKEYILNEIKQYRVVTCPHDSCSEILEHTSPNIKRLPIDLREKYYKISILHTVNQNPNLRLCPRERCDGYINTE